MPCLNSKNGEKADPTLGFRKQKHESDFLVERNLPLVSADQISRISKSMFPDSKITSKSKCVDTSSTHISTGSAAKHIVIDLKYVLGESYWYNLAANGRSDRCLLVFIKHTGHNPPEFVKTLLQYIPNRNSVSTAKSKQCLKMMKVLLSIFSWIGRLVSNFHWITKSQRLVNIISSKE